MVISTGESTWDRLSKSKVTCSRSPSYAPFLLVLVSRILDEASLVRLVEAVEASKVMCYIINLNSPKIG